MKKTILLVSLAIYSWGAFAQHDHGSHSTETKKEMRPMAPMFKDKAIGNAYAKYTELKDALVATDIIKAKDAAALLVFALQDVKNGTNVLKEAKMVSQAKNMEDQRKMFAALSTEMKELVESTKLTMGIIYVDHCPMANGNTGAFWLSSEAGIANPYLGDKMLKCGSVKETIE